MSSHRSRILSGAAAVALAAATIPGYAASAAPTPAPKPASDAKKADDQFATTQQAVIKRDGRKTVVKKTTEDLNSVPPLYPPRKRSLRSSHYSQSQTAVRGG
ncbi:hypothetical protein GCM10009551_066240 [Nocardiopsis tropica]